MVFLDGGLWKRRKIDDELLELFYDLFLCYNFLFVDVIYRFKDIIIGLGVFIIGFCNVVDFDNGCSFNKVVCMIKFI